jgi:hypothetical protein
MATHYTDNVAPFIGKRVRVHYNLNAVRSGTAPWCVVHKGRVVARCWHVGLINAVAHVGQNAARKIAAGGNRSVHAWVTGVLSLSPVLDCDSAWQLVGYNPRDRKEAAFTYRATGAAFTRCDAVAFTDKGMRARS